MARNTAAVIASAFIILGVYALMQYVYHVIYVNIYNFNNNQNPGVLNTPEYAVMNNIIFLLPGIVAFVVLIYVVRHGKPPEGGLYSS